MDVRPSGSSGGPYFCDRLAARNQITDLNKILIVVSVQHFAAIIGLDNDRVSIAAFHSAFNDASGGNRPDRRPGGSSDVGARMKSRFAVDRVPSPALGRADDPIDRD